jgi:predicted unusual protein kinase regulating ubiquinone biosynthesis (AarF/ABC1/UbiB family)
VTVFTLQLRFATVIRWDEVHALNSDRLLDLCLDLRGFYLKSGQFLGTRSDFMPQVRYS